METCTVTVDIPVQEPLPIVVLKHCTILQMCLYSV